MDLSKLSDADLNAVLVGDMTKVSDAGLGIITGAPPAEPSALKTIGTNLLAGAAGTVAGAGSAITGYLGADDVSGSLKASRDYWAQKSKDAGGDTLTGSVSHLVGGIAPAFLAPAGFAAQQATNAALFTIPAFKDTYEERIKEGDSQALAIAQATKAAAMAQLMPGIARKGSQALSKVVGGGEGVLKELGLSAAEGLGFTAADTAATKAIDTAAGKDTQAGWLPTGKDALTSAIAFPILRGAHMLTEPPKPPVAEKPPVPEVAPPTADAIPEPTVRGTAEKAGDESTRVPGLLQEQDAAVQAATTPEEVLAAYQKYDAIDTALKDALTEFHQLYAQVQDTGPVKAALPPLAAQYTRTLANMQTAKEQGDYPLMARYAQKALGLNANGAADAAVAEAAKIKAAAQAAKTFAKNAPTIASEMAAGREAAAAQRTAQDDTEGHKQYLTQLEIDQMEAGRMDTKMPMQMTILGTGKELRSQVVRGVGVEGKSIPELIADIQAAKETRNRSATIAAIEALRDARAKVANPPAPAGAATPDLITAQPTQVAAQQDAGISRGQAMAKLMQQKAPDAVEAAKGQVLSRLVTDIETTRGAPLERTDRQALHAEAAPILDTLMAGPRTMTAARDAQTALDAIRNRLSVRTPVDTTVERVYPKETPREVPPEVVPDTRTTDMFPDEKTQAEQHAATEAAYNDLLSNPDAQPHSRDVVVAAQHAAEMEQARLGGEFRAHAEMESLYPAEAIRPTPRLPEQITKDGVTITREAAPPKQVILAKEGQPVALNADTLRATLPEGTQSQREAADAARVKAANAMAERLATQTSRETVQFKALQAAHDALVSKDANGDPITVEERKAILRAHMADPETKKDAKSAAKTALNKILRAEKYLEKRGDDSSERLVQAEEHAHLTRERIPELEARVKSKRKGSVEALGEARTRAKQLDKILKATAIAERETPAEIAAKKFEAETYLKQDRADALAYEGTTGALPQRKLGPLTRKGTMAGSPRTGDLETVPERALTNRNPVVQDGKVRTTGRQLGKKGMQEANRLADEIKTKEPVPIEHEGVAAAEDRLQEQLSKQVQDAGIRYNALKDNPRAAQALKDKLKLSYDSLSDRLREATRAVDRRNTALKIAAMHNAKLGKKAEPQASEEDAKAALYESDLESRGKLYDEESDFAGEYEASAMFRTNEIGGKSTSVDEVRRITEGVTKDWKALPEIRYVQHENELPLRLRGYIVKTKNEGNVPGMRDSLTGKVWMIGDNIHSEKDAVLTVLHEVAGHHGLREILGKTYDSTMQSIYEGNADARAKADAKMAKNDTLTKEVAVEEVLADMAEKAPQSNAVKRVLYELKKWAYQKLGLKNVSDSDMLQIVANARRYAETGKGKAAEEAVAGAEVPTLRTQEKDSAIVGREPSTWDKVKGNWGNVLALRMQTADALAAVEAGVQAGEKSGKVSLHDATAAYYTMRKAEHAMNVAEHFISIGPKKWVADKAGDYYDAGEEGANLVNMTQYAAAAKVGSETETKRMLTSLGVGARAEARKGGWEEVNRSNPAAAKAKYDADVAYLNAHPVAKKNMQRALEEYKKTDDGVIDFSVQNGIMSKEEGEQYKNSPYAPYYRIKDGDVLFTNGEHTMNVGSLKDYPELKQMLGGDQHIKDLLTSATQNIYMLTRMGLANKARIETSNALYKAGFISHMGEGKGPPGADTINYKIGGKDVFAKIDSDTFGIPADLIVKGMEGIKTTLPALVKIMGIPANLVRKLVTLMPSYAIRQFFKEPINSALLTGTDGVPVANALKQMLRMRAGRNETADKLMHASVISSRVYKDSSPDFKRLLDSASFGKTTLSKFLHGLEKFALQSDIATRASIYDDAIKKGMGHTQALLRVMESQNFMRHGLSPSMRMLNTMIPFFNAQVQGIDLLYRTASGKMPFSDKLEIQRKLKARGLMLAMGATAYAMMMQDDPDYKNATPAERAANAFVRVPGIDAVFKLPLWPWEAGVLFGSLPILAVDSAMGDTKFEETAQGLWQIMQQQLIPNVLPTALAPPLNAMRNSTSFGAIETARDQRTLATYRSKEDTPEAMKLAGKITGQVGISAITLNEMAKEYTGGMSDAVLHMMDPLLTQLDAEKPKFAATSSMTKIPFFGGLFRTEEGKWLIQRAYDRMEGINQAAATFKDLVAKGRVKEATAFMQQYQNKLALEKFTTETSAQLNKWATMERTIKAHPTMTTEQKDMLLKKIHEAENAAAKQFVGIVDRTGTHG